LPHLPSRDLIDLVQVFSASSPPLGFFSGFDQARFISSSHAASWAISIPTLPPSSAEDRDEEKMMNGAEDGREMVWPRKWLDLRGEVMERDFRRAVRCVCGWLITRPGISEVSSFSLPLSSVSSSSLIYLPIASLIKRLLRTLLHPFFDRLEINDILRYLLQNGIATRAFHPRPGLDGEIPQEVGWLSSEAEEIVSLEMVHGRWLQA
jgi:hypothetical protein